jgi:hypothetical protein
MPDNILGNKDKRLDSVPEGFVNSVSGMESDIMKSIERLVSTLKQRTAK